MAKRFDIVDIPNQRSSHTKLTIRGGGVLFFAALLIYFFHTNFEEPLLFGGFTLLAVTSFIDDVKGLSVKQRIPVQFVAIMLLLFHIYGLTSVSVLLFIVILFTGVLAINCFNFIDGINGMLGFYSLVVLVILAIINYHENLVNPFLIWLPLLSLLVFGFYNFRLKALFFSGDVGSMTLALLIFYLVTLFTIELEAPMLLLIISVYLTDTIGTLVKRFVEKKNIFAAHREHLYERLANVEKVPHLRISLLYGFVQAVLGIIVLFLYKLNLGIQIIVVLIGAIAMAFTYFLLNRKIGKELEAI